MMQEQDDLCSTVSTIEGSFAGLEDDGSEGEDGEEVELKYVPPEDEEEEVEGGDKVPKEVGGEEVKTEVEEDEENRGQEFINLYLGKDGVKKPGVKRRGRSRKNVRVEDDEDADDEWKPKGNRKDKGKPRGRRKVFRLTEEEKRERATARKRRQREREKEAKGEMGVTPTTPTGAGGRPRRKKVRFAVSSGDENETFGDLVEDGDVDSKDADWTPDVDGDEVEEKKVTRRKGGAGGGGGEAGTKVKKRKRVADMTPEQVEKERQRKRDYRLRMKLMREELKRELLGGGGGDEETDGSTSRDASLVKEEGEGGSKGKSRRIADMTPEQAAKERARWRARKDRERELRALLKQEITGEGDSEAKIRLLEQVCGNYRRKRLSEMTPEERDKIRQKWHEQHLRRMARRAALPLDEQQQEKNKYRDRARNRRALAKETAVTPEQFAAIEEERRKDRERRRARRAQMTPEQRKEESRKNILSRQKKLAMMTEEEKQEERQRKYFQQQAKLAMMTPEEREAKKERDKQKRKNYQKTSSYAKLVEKYGIEGIREKRRRAWREMSPGKKQQKLEKFRECYRNRIEKLKEDPEKWAEVQARWKERDRENKRRRKEGVATRTRQRLGEPPAKEKEEGGGAKWKRWKPETEEEVARQKERQLQLKRVQNKKWRLKKKLGYLQKLLDSGMSMEEINQQTESNHQRERRCIRQRIRKAKNQLRNRLQDSGVPPEEISKRLEEVKHTYTPTHAIRPYKPRPDKRKPVDPKDIVKIQNEIEMLDKIAAQVAQGQTVVPALAPAAPPIRSDPVITALVEACKPEVGSGITPPPEIKTPRKKGKATKTPEVTPSPPQPPPAEPPQPSTSQSVIIQRVPIVIQPSTSTSNQPQHQVQPVVQVVQPASITYANQQYTYTYHPTSQYPPPAQPTFTYAPQGQVPPLQQPIIVHHPPQTAQQQQQPPPPTIHAHTLQHILDSITFQDASTPQHQATYQQHPSYQASVASSQPEEQYANSSYFDDDAPPSPGNNYDDSYSQSSYQSQVHPDYHPQQPPSQTEAKQEAVQVINPATYFSPNQTTPTSTSTSTSPTKRGRPKGSRGAPTRPSSADGSKTRVRKYYYRPPKNPNAKLRTKKVDVIRDAMCDECGVAYNRLSLRAHQNQMHNPNYDRVNRKCRLCGETYKHGQKWYTHYLQDHVRSTQPAKEKSCVCEQCGQMFVNQGNYKKHMYYQHGEGLNPENYIQCPLCPQEKRFKEKIGYYSHLKRFHPDYERPGHDCFRCEKSLANEKMLCEHVAEMHPESYFPCPYCKACKFTRMGLHFHFGRCTNIGRQEKERLEKEWKGGVFTLERWPIKCEFCQKQVIVSSLTRHYKEMHNVVEDRFACGVCKKTFKSRPFWVNHLEEKHGKTMEELGGFVHKLNAVNREGFSEEPRKGGWEDWRLSKELKEKRQEKREKRKKKQGGGRGKEGEKKRGRGRPRKKREEEEEVDDGEETTENEEEVLPKRGRPRRKAVRKKRRKIVVICEEDEERKKTSVKKQEEEMEEYPEVKVEVDSEVESSQEENNGEDEESSGSQ